MHYSLIGKGLFDFRDLSHCADVAFSWRISWQLVLANENTRRWLNMYAAVLLGFR